MRWKILFAVLIQYCSATAHASTQIVIAADIWCPYNCDNNAAQPGYMVELARQAFKAKGIEVEYRIMPWSRALKETQEGQIDGAIGTAKAESPGLVFPAEEQGRMRNAFWIKKDDPWRYKGIASLQRVILGYIASYSYSRDVDAYIANPLYQQKIAALHGRTAIDSALGMLVAGHIDAFIEDESVVRYNLQRMHLHNIINGGDVNFEPDRQNLYIAFTPVKAEASRWANILSEGTVKMRANGQLAELLQGYGLRDWRSTTQ